MQQRYYDPDGRFISPDPVRPTPGNIYNFNRYAYANGNPLRYTDPTGMSSSPACGEVSCAVARMRRLSDSMIFGKAGSWMRSFQHAMDKAGSAVNSAIKKVHVKSVFVGDTKPTYTGVAAYGLGVVAHKTAGPNNDEVALTPAGLGLEATATWHLLDISVNLSNVKPSPIFISGLSGRAGVLGVLGIELRYTAPGKYELDITGGFGAAADVHMLDVGTNVSQLDGE
ncbi:MAG TPA: RHS repeat-associated core domain-containing protein, partial [Rhodanobacteraceae bacterium]|nr:RHS repeat-associated core domain-containing protein [Rhodanobacteraceae bacterium]